MAAKNPNSCLLLSGSSGPEEFPSLFGQFALLLNKRNMIGSSPQEEPHSREALLQGRLFLNSGLVALSCINYSSSASLSYSLFVQYLCHLIKWYKVHETGTLSPEPKTKPIIGVYTYLWNEWNNVFFFAEATISQQTSIKCLWTREDIHLCAFVHVVISAGKFFIIPILLSSWWTLTQLPLFFHGSITQSYILAKLCFSVLLSLYVFL